MRIPEFCGAGEFVRSLERNREMIDTVLATFDAGAFSKTDLEKLVTAARRTTYVCSELIKWKILEKLIESAPRKGELDGIHFGE